MTNEQRQALIEYLEGEIEYLTYLVKILEESYNSNSMCEYKIFLAKKRIYLDMGVRYTQKLNQLKKEQ